MHFKKQVRQRKLKIEKASRRQTFLKFWLQETTDSHVYFDFDVSGEVQLAIWINDKSSLEQQLGRVDVQMFVGFHKSK